MYLLNITNLCLINKDADMTCLLVSIKFSQNEDANMI